MKRVGAAASILVVDRCSCSHRARPRSCRPRATASSSRRSPGTITDPKIVEPSGVVASAENANTLWILQRLRRHREALRDQRDRRDARHVHAVGRHQRSTGKIIALGSRAGRRSHRTSTPADIGDNSWNRSQIVVYRVAEPTVGGAAAQTLTGVDKLTFTYPDRREGLRSVRRRSPHRRDVLLPEVAHRRADRDLPRAGEPRRRAAPPRSHKVGTLNLPSGEPAARRHLRRHLTGRQLDRRAHLRRRSPLEPRAGPDRSSPRSAANRAWVPCRPRSRARRSRFRPDSRGYYTVSEGATHAPADIAPLAVPVAKPVGSAAGFFSGRQKTASSSSGTAATGDRRDRADPSSRPVEVDARGRWSTCPRAIAPIASPTTQQGEDVLVALARAGR